MFIHSLVDDHLGFSTVNTSLIMLTWLLRTRFCIHAHFYFFCVYPGWFLGNSKLKVAGTVRPCSKCPPHFTFLLVMHEGSHFSTCLSTLAIVFFLYTATILVSVPWLTFYNLHSWFHFLWVILFMGPQFFKSLQESFLWGRVERVRNAFTPTHPTAFLLPASLSSKILPVSITIAYRGSVLSNNVRGREKGTGIMLSLTVTLKPWRYHRCRSLCVEVILI